MNACFFSIRARSDRKKRREEMKSSADLLQIDTTLVSPKPDDVIPGIPVQTETSLSNLKALEDDYKQRMSENLELKDKLQSANKAFTYSRNRPILSISYV